MTENAFPFEGAVEESAGGGDRRKMVLVAGLGALIVAVLGYFVVMPALSGSSTDSTPFTIVKKPQAKAKAPAKPAAKKKAPVQPAQYDDLAARTNPFRPLWVPPKETAVEAAAPAAAPVTYTPPTTGGTTTGTTTTTPPEAGTQRVSLMTIFTKDGVSYAQTKVGDVVYLPRVGQEFATSFKLLAVTAKTATYLFGDEQFTLSIGQEVLK